MHHARGSLGRDSLFYMSGKLVEGIVGILTLSFYTHSFPEGDYGRYVTLNTVVISVSMIAIQGLLQSSVRYASGYESRGQGRAFFSTALFLWVRLAAVMLAAGGGAALAITSLSGVFAPAATLVSWFPARWLWMAAGSLVTYSGAQFVLALLSARRQILTNLGLSLFGTAARFIIPLALVKCAGAGVGVIFAAGLIADGIIMLVGARRAGLLFRARKCDRSAGIAKEMNDYGLPLMGNMVTGTILNVSDRLLVAPIAGPEANGIYSANYQIPAVFFTMLNFAMGRASYPNILKAWGEGDAGEAKRLLSRSVKLYLIVALPAAVGMGAVAQALARLILAPEFAAGFPVMVWVAGGMFLSGLTDYSNKYWELNSKTGPIFRMGFLCGLFNIAANLIFITRLGYMAAAISTFASFLLYFLISRRRSFREMPWNLPAGSYVRIFGSAAAMGVAVTLAGLVLNGIVFIAVAVPCGAVLYFGLLYALGEIREEVGAVVSGLKRCFHQR